MHKHGRFYDAKGRVPLGSTGDIEFNLPIIVFEEDGATICYCPALDLSGYGMNEREARDSFAYVISEYFDYTEKKKTLTSDLRRLGWDVKNSLRKKIVPPSTTKLLDHNANFKRVFENFDYKKSSTPVKIPAFA